MKHILSAKQIVKYFDDATHPVLNHIDVTICEKEFVVIMGPSGSGKSTLLYALSGMDKIDSGEIHFDGQNLAQLSDNQLADIRRNRMGFVFQQPTMLANLNLLDNITLPAWNGSQNKKELIKKAETLMQMAGISDLASREITKVSGGQLQRAGICRALIGNPQILFADEPTGALNSKSAEEIMDLFCQVHRQGTAILLVTHDAHVATYADRVLFMRDGVIMTDLSFEQIRCQSKEAKLDVILQEMRKVEGGR